MQMVVSPAHESCYWLFSIDTISITYDYIVYFHLESCLQIVKNDELRMNRKQCFARCCTPLWFGLRHTTRTTSPGGCRHRPVKWVGIEHFWESVYPTCKFNQFCLTFMVSCSHLPLYSSACMMNPPFKQLAAGTTQGMPVPSTQLPRWFAAFEAIQKLKQPKTNETNGTIWKHHNSIMKQKKRMPRDCRG